MERHVLPFLPLVAAFAAAGVWACTDSGASDPEPRPPASFGIQPALDTVDVGDTVSLVAERADSAVDEWTVSDTALARLLSRHGGRATLLARAAGTVTVKATRQGHSDQATLVVVTPPPPPPAPPGWEVIDLGVTDECGGRAWAINDSGTIVGQRFGACYNGTHGGFIYKDGVMRTLAGGVPLAITPSGRMVGAGGSSSILVWDDADAAPRPLSRPGDSYVSIRAVNALGDILVNDEYVGVTPRAILWRNEVPVDLESLIDSTDTYPGTAAYAFNDSRQIVGASQVRRVRHIDSEPTDVYHPFLWADGVMRDLGVLTQRPCERVATPVDCARGAAADINAHGVVVGWVNGTDVHSRAFIWEDGIMRDLGAYPGHMTRAWWINDRGQVLGTVGHDTTFFWENGQAQIVIAQDSWFARALGPNGEVIGTMISEDSVEHAFIWEAGQLTDLGLGRPVAINSGGEIVGSLRSAGVTRAILWRKKRR